VLVNEIKGTNYLTAVCKHAQDLGIQANMILADARILVPELDIAKDNSAIAAKALCNLANLFTRFTPWVALHGINNLYLDVSGCSDLFGGELNLINRLRSELHKSIYPHLTAHIAIADTAGAAWAISHFTDQNRIPPGENKKYLSTLPLAALRLDEAMLQTLQFLGLNCVGDLLKIPRASLAKRFDCRLLSRLDQALGTESEPISPRQPIPISVVQKKFLTPIISMQVLAQVIHELLVELCEFLKRRNRAVRCASLSIFPTNSHSRQIKIETSRKICTPNPLATLFNEHLQRIRLDLRNDEGVEAVKLEATLTERSYSTQGILNFRESSYTQTQDDNDHALCDLLDRLTNRLTKHAVIRFAPHQSHVPERAVKFSTSNIKNLNIFWDIQQPRPLHLFNPPIPVEAVAMTPDKPPVLFKWKDQTHRVIRASGPERISGEWWKNDTWTRDYYQVENRNGARFWLYREGLYHDTKRPKWWLHGLFA
jgi:protein ImuB